MPNISVKLPCVIVRYIELVRAVSVKVSEHRCVLKATRISVNILGRPLSIGIAARLEQPDALAKGRDDHLTVTVAIAVTDSQKTCQTLAGDPRDDRPILRLSVGLVATNLDGVRNLSRHGVTAIRQRFDHHIKLVSAVSVHVGDEDLLGVPITKVGYDRAAILLSRYVPDDRAVLLAAFHMSAKEL